MLSMKIRLLLFPLLTFYLLAISATTIHKNYATVSGKTRVSGHAPVASVNMKAKKLSFFKKIFLKLFVRKSKAADESKAGKLSSTSLFLGIASWALLLLGLAVPYV